MMPFLERLRHIQRKLKQSDGSSNDFAKPGGILWIKKGESATVHQDQGGSKDQRLSRLAHQAAFWKAVSEKRDEHIENLQNKNHELRDEKRQVQEELEMYKHFVRGLKCSPSEFRQTRR